MSVEELEQVLAEKKQQRKDKERERRENYECLRADLVRRVREKVHAVTEDKKGVFTIVTDETGAFREVMGEYGALRGPGQMSFTIADNGFRILVKSNKVKRFDERADIAATRLIEFLQGWIEKK